MHPLLLAFHLGCGDSPKPQGAQPVYRELHAYGAATDAFPVLSGTVRMGSSGHLRSAPDVEGALLLPLKLGAAVVVLGPIGDPVELIDRPQRWYRIRSGTTEGFVFGALLTPYGSEAAPSWALTYTHDLHPLLRVEQEGRASMLELELSHRLTGGFFRAETRSFGPGTEWLVTQCNEDGSRCADGVARFEPTLKQMSVPDRADFAPQLLKNPTCPEVKQLPVVPSTLERLPAIATPAGEVHCRRFGQLEGRPESVVDCALTLADPPRVDSDRFVQHAPDHWERITCSSTLDRNLLPERLQDRGIRLTERDATELSGRFTRREAYQMRLVRHAPEDLEPGEPVAKDPVIGDLFVDADGMLAMPQPQGHLVYSHDPRVPGYAPRFAACGGTADPANVFVDLPTEPERIRHLDGAFFLPESLAATLRPALPPNLPPEIDRPWVLARSPHGRWTLLTDTALRPKCETP